MTFAFFQIFFADIFHDAVALHFTPSYSIRLGLELKNLGERLYLPSNLFAAEEDPPPQVLVKASFFFSKFLRKGIACLLNSFGHHFDPKRIRRPWWPSFGYFEATSLATYCSHDAVLSDVLKGIIGYVGSMNETAQTILASYHIPKQPYF